MEKLLHYIWKQRILPLAELLTTDGQKVEILDPGLHNRNAGPDFYNAKEYLERDIRNVNRFFRHRGAETIEDEVILEETLNGKDDEEEEE